MIEERGMNNARNVLYIYICIIKSWRRDVAKGRNNKVGEIDTLDEVGILITESIRSVRVINAVVNIEFD